MKKYLGIFLLLVLTAPFVVCFSWLQLEKHQIKREVKWKMIAGIDRSELVLLQFSIDESENLLKWKHSKEFEYNGEMYDVVEKLEGKDSISYWCWWDHEETKLNKQLTELIEQTAAESPNHQKNKEQLFQYLNSLYFTAPVDWISNQKEILKQIYSGYKNDYSSLSFPPSSPPPDFI